MRGRAVIVALLLLAAGDAMAAGGGNAILSGLNAIINFLNSGVVRALAVISVIALFAAGFAGRLDWHRAVVLVICICGAFSATFLVDLFAGGF